MPIKYDIDDGLIVVLIDGAVTPEDFYEYIAASGADPRYHPDMPRLIEIADDASFPSSMEIIAGAAKTSDRMRMSQARFAYVARAPIARGIASMFMGNAGLGERFQIFESVADARKWLLPDDPR